MKIAFDVQPLIDSQKTGVGMYTYFVIKSLLIKFPSDTYILRYFSSGVGSIDNIKAFCGKGCILDKCSWFRAWMYKVLWTFLPVPYGIFFHKRAEVTQFFNYHVPPFVPGKSFVVVYDMVYKSFPETVRWKTKIMLDMNLKASCRRADRIITISEFSKREIMEYFKVPPNKITVAYCGVDRFIFNENISEETICKVLDKLVLPRKYLLYLGTLEPRKNIERLIEAYSAVKREKPEETPVLVIAGRKGWMYDTIFEKVQKSSLQDSIIFTGYVEDKDVPVLMKGALIFLFPSLYEGFGLPVLEAMACGTPVLTSTVSSLPEVAGDSCLLVDPYSLNEITGAIKRLIEDDDLRYELSQKGLARCSKFSWEATAETFIDAYRQMYQ